MRIEYSIHMTATSVNILPWIHFLVTLEVSSTQPHHTFDMATQYCSLDIFGGEMSL